MRWLFRFAASQKNINCAAKWVGRVVVELGIILATVLVTAIIRR